MWRVNRAPGGWVEERESIAKRAVEMGGVCSTYEVRNKYKVLILQPEGKAPL
jgi:hypothetical protein